MNAHESNASVAPALATNILGPSDTIVSEVMAVLESLNGQKEKVKQELQKIDNEIQNINQQISTLQNKKLQLIEQRRKLSKLLDLFTDNINVNSSRTRDTELEEKVYEYIKANQPISIYHIARDLGKAPSTIYHACNRLLAKGLITKEGSKFKVT